MFIFLFLFFNMELYLASKRINNNSGSCFSFVVFRNRKMSLFPSEEGKTEKNIDKAASSFEGNLGTEKSEK